MVLTQQFLTQSAASSQSSLSVSFIIPFQLSPVATLNRVRKAIPKLLKWACSPNPWQGISSLHSVRNNKNPSLIKRTRDLGLFYGIDWLIHVPSRPNSSTPSAANMKNNRKKRRPRFPTWGKACITVSRRARIPFAILRSFKTVNR